MVGNFKPFIKNARPFRTWFVRQTFTLDPFNFWYIQNYSFLKKLYFTLITMISKSYYGLLSPSRATPNPVRQAESTVQLVSGSRVHCTILKDFFPYFFLYHENIILFFGNIFFRYLKSLWSEVHPLHNLARFFDRKFLDWFFFLNDF